MVSLRTNWGAVALLLVAGTVLGQEKTPDIAPDPAERFPEAEGKEAVTGTCSACHTLVRVATNRRTAKAWAATIKIHQQQRGLKLEPEEIPPIVEYLAAWFGPMVNVNSATVQELCELPQVSKSLAEAIVAYRQKNGPFQSVSGLESVEGFPAGLLPKLKPRLETGGAQGKNK
jgi:competence protein ComEA